MRFASRCASHSPHILFSLHPPGRGRSGHETACYRACNSLRVTRRYRKRSDSVAIASRRCRRRRTFRSSCDLWRDLFELSYAKAYRSSRAYFVLRVLHLKTTSTLITIIRLRKEETFRKVYLRIFFSYIDEKEIFFFYEILKGSVSQLLSDNSCFVPVVRPSYSFLHPPLVYIANERHNREILLLLGPGYGRVANPSLFADKEILSPACLAQSFVTRRSEFGADTFSFVSFSRAANNYFPRRALSISR